jgi:copper chaperone NosL
MTSSLIPHRSSFHLGIALTLWLVTLLTACGGSANAEPTPPTIHYGEDMCQMCGMIISDERRAAAYVTRSGESFIFDDTGEMVKHHLQNPTEVAVFFVHDYEAKSWIRGETAYYILSDKITTPMLSGLVASASKEKAQSLAAESTGQVMTFDEVLAHYGQNSEHGH